MSNITCFLWRCLLSIHFSFSLNIPPKPIQYYSCWCPGGSCPNVKSAFSGIGISIIKIWWSLDRLIFIMGIHILVTLRLYIVTRPWLLALPGHQQLWHNQSPIQSSAVITRCNTTWYCTQYSSYWVRIYPEFVFKTDTPYLALTGDLWGVCYEECGENIVLYWHSWRQ